MRSLIIVESPTKAKTLSRFLGCDYRIEATMGHVRDLPENKLGITIEKKNDVLDFIPFYVPIKARKDKIAELKKMAIGIRGIILATDPDREGEAIAYHVKELLEKGTFQRIVFHEITKSAIDYAISHPREIDKKLVDAQQARRLLDRLVGYKLSPLLWNKLGKRWLSAGRVQSVAVRLIVEREREIKAFVAVEYWVIEVELTPQGHSRTGKDPNRDRGTDGNSRLHGNDPANFLAKLVEIDGKKAEVGNKEHADRIVEDLKNAQYQVKKVETKEVRRFPAAPFTTSTLQQSAANKFGWSAKRTMRTAQNLYEEGFITYHRTDSTNLSAEAIALVRAFIPAVFGESFLPLARKLYKTKSKVAQEAHEAIRPTDIALLGNYDLKKLKVELILQNNLKALPLELGRDGELLYSMIWKRFVACQMKEALFDQTSVTIMAKRYPIRLAAESPIEYILRVSGQTMKFPGWLIAYGDRTNQEENDNKENEENAQLPPLKEEEFLKFIQVIPNQKFTEPPPRFNEASLIKALEELGIGRPSTYAPIISTIQDRKYVEKIERKFYPTDLGMTVVDFLVKYFADIFDVTFTARMEGELDDIANGTLVSNTVLQEFYIPFANKLDEVFKTAKPVKVDLGTTDEKCPRCGAVLAIRMSRFGKFLACSTFPKCKFTKNIAQKLDIKCPRCQSVMVVKKTRRGKQFYGCGSYPTCTFAAWKKEDIK